MHTNIQRSNTGSFVMACVVTAALNGCAGPTLLADLSQQMHGRFDTHAPGHTSSAALAQRLVDSRQRIELPELGEHVFYLQLNQGETLDLYRQRILLLEYGAKTGTVRQRAYTIEDPARFLDALSGDPKFDVLSLDDLKPMFQPGCEQIWTRTLKGYRGYVDPATCLITSKRTGKPRRIEAETVLNGDTMSLVERGYDDDMKQLFGTPQGSATTLLRQPPR